MYMKMKNATEKRMLAHIPQPFISFFVFFSSEPASAPGRLSRAVFAENRSAFIPSHMA